MVLFHGTTLSRARRIQIEGFRAKSPSRMVWFAKHKGIALNRARHKARRGRDTPVVLTCDLNLPALRKSLGSRRVRVQGSVVVVDGPVPASVLTESSSVLVPSRPDHLRIWVNRLLGFAPHEGVGRTDPGLDRLSRWLDQRIASNPVGDLKREELLEVGAQCLPGFFKRGRPDFERVSVPSEHEDPEPEPDEDSARSADTEKALGLMASESPAKRVRGLGLLVKTEDPDLLDWCLMYLGDPSADVRVAALDTMCGCEHGDPEAIVPLAGSDDKRIRAAAVAVLARHSGKYAPLWFEYGLADPSACVRLKTASLLGRLDPAEHRKVFELALHDPNPTIVRSAKKLTAGKGYARASSQRA